MASDDDVLGKLVRTDSFEAAIESDRQFFRDHPHRKYRLRPAAWAEVSALEVDGAPIIPPLGTILCVGVKQHVPGFRSRVFFFAPAAASTWAEATEREAKSWFKGIARRIGAAAVLKQNQDLANNMQAKDLLAK